MNLLRGKGVYLIAGYQIYGPTGSSVTCKTHFSLGVFYSVALMRLAARHSGNESNEVKTIYRLDSDLHAHVSRHA
jgi:hypothetical protein